jgi:hypothetical protein
LLSNDPALSRVGRQGCCYYAEQYLKMSTYCLLQAPFTSAFVGSILAKRTHVKRFSQRSRAFAGAPVSSQREILQGGLG